jgi:SAM-dependent methyltransferase
MPENVHPYVQEAIEGTNGRLYRSLVGKMTVYPIPEIRLPRTNGAKLLDVGCGWGRWTIPASRNGYLVTGVDKEADAVSAAKCISNQLRVRADFICADARYLPFTDGSFDVVFSYSVIQHLSESDARLAFSEIGRVLRPAGVALIQMPNKYGVRSAYQRFIKHFRGPDEFEVHYWSPCQVKAVAEQTIGLTTLSVDGYFGLNIQPSDYRLLPLCGRAVISASQIARALQRVFAPMLWVADSLYAESRRR